MILPLYVALEKIDGRLIEAAYDLYASRWQAFRRVTLPLALPGVFAGTLLTFIPAMGDFVNAQLLGNPNTTMIGNVIQNRFLIQNDYPTAAALSFVLMLGILIAVFVYASAPRHRAVDRLMAAAIVRSLRHAAAAHPRDRESCVCRPSPSWRSAICSFRSWSCSSSASIAWTSRSATAGSTTSGMRSRIDAWLHPLDWPGLGPSLYASLWIAVMSTIAATILGTLIGLALTRYSFRGRGADQRPDLPADGDAGTGHGLEPRNPVRGHGLPPLRDGPVPTLYPFSITTILIAHMMFNISYVVVTVKARLAGFDRRLEEAAMDLGANEWTTFWRVTFPLIFPGIMAAALLAFSLSIDDFIITSFVSGHAEHVPDLRLRRHPQCPAGADQRHRVDHLPRGGPPGRLVDPSNGPGAPLTRVARRRRPAPTNDHH